MKTVEKMEEKKLAIKKLLFNTPSGKSPKPKPRSRFSVLIFKGKGVKIVDPASEEEKDKIMAKSTPSHHCLWIEAGGF